MLLKVDALLASICFYKQQQTNNKNRSKSSASDWLLSLSLMVYDCNKPQAYMDNCHNSWSCGYFISGDWLLRTTTSDQHRCHSNKYISKPLSMAHIDICVWTSNNDVIHNVTQPIVKRITWQIGSDKRGVDHKSQVYIYSVLTFPYWHPFPSITASAILFYLPLIRIWQAGLVCIALKCCIKLPIDFNFGCVYYDVFFYMHALICSFRKEKGKKERMEKRKCKWFMM